MKAIASVRVLTAALLVGACVSATSGAGTRPGEAVAPLTDYERTLIAAAVDTIASGWADSTGVCVAILGGPEGAEAPDRELLQSLRTRLHFTTHAACPRTYASMILRVDSAGRPLDPPPAGYVDPHYVWVGRPQFQQRQYGWLYVRRLKGTGGQDYVCMVEQSPPAAARAHCSSRLRWVH